LLPEGARHHYDKRGLPPDTIIESTEDYEKAIIPPAVRDLATLPTRLVLKDILSPVERVAFAGTNSLNPMQSAVFERAFHSRNNLLVCAPTGAGKTNVALLTVVAHFRDVGLLPKDRDNQEQGKDEPRRMETGRKVIYIAPMKALAQEVVEKFSSKLKPLRLIVKELTGDMQLSRAEAEAANVIVTVREVVERMPHFLHHYSCTAPSLS
jgi:replicative superfamily II helicase